MNSRWQQVWAARQIDETHSTTLAQLMAADGLDTGYGTVTAENWAAFVGLTATRLQLSPSDTVFEVGCGAGGFLYELFCRGINVGGLDYSPALIDMARHAMPAGAFAVGEADSVDTSIRVDIVLSCGVFMYFNSLDYAARTIAKMAQKATRAVAILDVPDLARAKAALRHRADSAGGEDAYRHRYEGLDHLYYDKQWMIDTCQNAGLIDVTVVDQAIDGYENAQFRFNVYGKISHPSAQ